MNNLIEKIEIPIKLPIKTTNSIIVYSDPLTIIDPGAKGEKTLEIFNERLKKKNKSLKDIKRIILTHGHIDHYGVAKEIKKYSNCDIYIHKYDLQKATRINRIDDDFALKYKKLLIENGSNEKGPKGMDDFFYYIKDMYDPLNDVLDIENKFYFENLQLHVIETPGHTKGSIVLYEPESKMLFSGDTIINGISPNPVIEFEEDGSRFNSQEAYINTLNKLKYYSFSKIIGGHGEDILDFDDIYNKYNFEREKKFNKLISLFKEYHKLTPFEAMELIYGELMDFQIFLGMSEMIGSFDYLASQKIIKIIKEKGVYKGKYILN